MAIALYIQTITAAIKNLSISGVKVVDTDKVMAAWGAQTNVMYPNINPPGFITDGEIEYLTNLRGLDAPLNFHYVMNYRFIGTKLGDLSNIGSAYTDLLEKVLLITSAVVDIASLNNGKVLIELKGFPNMGMKEDPAGNQYHGADFELAIVEVQNL